MAEPDPQAARQHASPRSGTARPNVRVALIAGTGPVATDDLHKLLRRRLLVLSSFLAATVAILTILTMADGPDPDLPGFRTQRDVLISSLKFFVLVAINLTAALLLWRRPPQTLFGLRLVEVAVIGPIVLMWLFISVTGPGFEFLETAPQETPRVGRAFIDRYSFIGGLLWFTVITAYGTLIPNTLRRAAVVTVLMAVSPVVLFFVYATWVRPLSPDVIAQVVLNLSISNGIAVALVLFATSRIEVLRQQASEARKLGQYVVKEKLGSGGMGEVFRAEHALLRRPCALKLIRSDRAGDPDVLRRFEREVQTTATLTHPNTIQVFDYGHAEDGTFYYVMEYLPGLTLEEIVEREGPLPPARVVHFLRQICGALQEAHSRELIHRDIKPGNVMICERGGIPDVAKLLDFGLVLPPISDADGEKLTQEGTVTGTPAYLSPEQVGGQEQADARSDIYSLGALAYFLLSGRPPFAGRSAVKILAAHLYEPPNPLPSNLPDDLAAAVMRCLAKVPEDRWPDLASLEEALNAASVPVWTADNATAWWEQASDSGRSTGTSLATATWTDPSATRGPDG